jgi:hypothetical protein
MTPTAWAGGAASARGHLLLVAEPLFDLVPPLLPPAERQGEIGYAVAHHVIGVVAIQRDQQDPLAGGAARPRAASSA